MTTTQGPCANCGITTAKRCSGCHNAPTYTTSTSTSEAATTPQSTYICSPACQKTIWLTHKKECKTIRARKELSRAASLLQDILLAIREHATMQQFDDVRVQKTANGVTEVVLRAVGVWADEERLLKRYPVLPAGLEGWVARGLKLNCACLAGKMYLVRWVEELLVKSGLCSTVEEVNVRVANPKLKISTRTPTGLVVPPEQFHNLYRVNLRTSTGTETWTVDPSGAQFGYPDPLAPWHELVSGRGWVLTQVLELGYVRNRVWNEYGLRPLRALVMQRVEKREICGELEGAIPMVARLFAGEGKLLAEVLKGSDEGFEEVRGKIGGLVGGIVVNAIKKFDMPDKVREREEKIRSVVSPDMADMSSDASRAAHARFVERYMARDLPN